MDMIQTDRLKHAFEREFESGPQKNGLFTKSKGEIQYSVLSPFRGKFTKIKQTVLELPKPF